MSGNNFNDQMSLWILIVFRPGGLALPGRFSFLSVLSVIF